MMNPQAAEQELLVAASLKDRIMVRLTASPECLNMAEFSMITACGTTFCLAGLILDESGIPLTYSHGIASGLGRGVVVPSRRWIAYERSLSTVPVPVHRVLIAAKARELWAAEYGDQAARMLPFYGPDWGGTTQELSWRVTSTKLIQVLEAINYLAAHKVEKLEQ